MDIAKINEKYIIPLLGGIVAGVYSVLSSIRYAYEMGGCWIYGIDSQYIDMRQENVLQQIFRTIVVFGILIITYFLIYYLMYSMHKNKGKIKRVLFFLVEITIFEVFEAIIITGIVMWCSNRMLTEMVSIPFYLFLRCFKRFLRDCFFNTLVGIYVCICYKTIKKVIVKKDKWKKEYIFPLIVALFVLYIFSYLCSFLTGVNDERQRLDYKVVVEKVLDKGNASYVFTTEENESGYILYPIIRETSDSYIMCRLDKNEESGEKIIDYSFQKIIKKEGVETFRTFNIYEIKAK